ncbi:MAG: molybdopterin-dependent oxidoreductase [Chloroflexi bacterium]|nr:molybdopterin-dependent oxidoreductase [Chloroflexota bacterium]
MRKPILLLGAATGGLLTGVVIALTYLGEQVSGLPFVPFDLFDWITRLLPGVFVDRAIGVMVGVINAFHLGPTASTAKSAEQAMGIIFFIIAGAILGLVAAALSRAHAASAGRIGLAMGAVGFLVSWVAESGLGFRQSGLLLTTLWMAILFLGVGALFGRWMSQELLPAQTSSAELAATRRQFLTWLWGSSVAFILATWGFSRINAAASGPATAQGPTSTPLIPNTGGTSGPAASPPLSVLEKRIPSVPGTRPEVTAITDFYRVDINIGVPTTDINTWRLVVDGLVETPLSLTLDQIRKLPSISQYATLSCISNPVGGDLISTAEFTGVPLKTVLAQAGLKQGAAFVNMMAFDGFYESLDMNVAMDERTILAYRMNGIQLLPEHGYPLRIFIPDLYGMKQPKWLSHLIVTDRLGPGYWVDRGWSQTAIVETTSVVDSVKDYNLDTQTNVLPVGGIAYAGDRGISKVEVQVDNSPWAPAELRDPPLSILTWVQWRYNYTYQPGRHVFRVRAYDGTGALQITQSSDPLPNGATGIDSFVADL